MFNFDRLLQVFIAACGALAVYFAWLALPAKDTAAGPSAGGITMTPWWAYAVMGLCGVAFISQWVRWSIGRYEKSHPKNSVFSKWPELYAPVVVIGKKFASEHVRLDGNSYQSCEFRNITIVYNGTTPVNLRDNHFFAPMRFHSNNPAVMGTIGLLIGLGVIDLAKLKIDSSPGALIEPAKWQ